MESINERRRIQKIKVKPEKLEDVEYMKELLFAINTTKLILIERNNKDEIIKTPVQLYEKVKFSSIENKMFDEPKDLHKLFSKFDTSLSIDIISMKMKIMENCSAYFSKLNEKECINLENTLIEIINKFEEPHVTNAIRCLQIIYYLHFYISKRYCTKIKNLANIILYRILKIIEPINESMNIKNVMISDPNNIFFDKIESDDCKYLGLDSHNINIRKFTYSRLLLSADVISLDEQIIHHLLLLNFMIPEILNNEFIESTHITDLLLNLMNPIYNPWDFLISVNLSIIRKFLFNYKFRKIFIEKRGIERLLFLNTKPSLINSVISCIEIISYYEISILFICENYTIIIPKMLKSLLESLKISQNQATIKILKNCLDYPDFFQCLVSINGFIESLNSIKRASWFIPDPSSDMFTIVFSCSRISKFFMIETLEYILSYWMHCFYNDHFLMDNKSVMSTNMNRIELNFDEGLNAIIKYLKVKKELNNNYLDIRYLYELSQSDFTTWLSCVTLKFARLSDHRIFSKLTKYCAQIIYILSLFEETHTLLFMPYGQISRVFGEGTSIIHCLKRMLSKCLRVCDPPYIYIFQIYINILQSYCIDYNTYRKYLIHNEYTLREIYCDQKFSNLKFLINNDLLYHCLYLSTYDTSYYYSLDVRLECFKCLYLLCGHFSACEMVSKFHDYFTKEIPSLFEELKSSEVNTDFYIEMYRYSENIIKRVNYYFLKNYKVPEARIHKQSLNMLCQMLAELGYNEAVEKFRLEIQKKYPESCHNSKPKICHNSIKTKELDNVISTKKYIYRNYNHSGRVYPPHTFNISNLNDYSNTSLRKYYKLRGYDLFYASNYYAGHPIQTENESDLTYAKYLNDDKIAIATANGFIVYSALYQKLQDIWSALKIHFIQQSRNNALLLGCGVEEYGSHSTHVWQYDCETDKFGLSPSVVFADLMHSNFSNSCKTLYGVMKQKELKAYDIETESCIGTFNDEENVSFYFQNYIDITYNDKLLYYNGSLFSTNENKLIHTFPRFNAHFSGIFLPSEQEILINTQLWDLRTFKLINVLSQFENTHLSKTFNEDIMYGVSYDEEELVAVYHKFNEIYIRSNQPPAKSMQFFDTTHFNPLGKEISLVNNVYCVDVNKRATKYLTIESLSNSLSQDVKSISIWEYAPSSFNLGKIDNFFVDAFTFLNSHLSLTDDSNDEASFAEDSPDENYEFANPSDFDTASEGQTDENEDDDNDEDYEDVDGEDAEE